MLAAKKEYTAIQSVHLKRLNQSHITLIRFNNNNNNDNDDDDNDNINNDNDDNDNDDNDNDNDNDNNTNIFNQGKLVSKCCHQRVAWATKNRIRITIKMIKKLQHMW